MELLEEQKQQLQHWLRFWPLRFLLDINVLQEISFVTKQIQRIEAKIAKLQNSKSRLDK